MRQTINFSQFLDAFQSIRPDNFTYRGLQALFDYLEDYEESAGDELELDVIALCCDFSEYTSLEELQQNYTDIESLEDLQGHTTVIEFDGGLIIQDF